jgi:hypothetical protein
MDFGRMHMTWKSEWRNIIWSDEKRFNLDGPDGFAYYWHDFLKEELIFSKRQLGGGSIMIWASFGWNFKSHITFIYGTLDAKAYQKVLTEHVDNIQRSFGTKPWIFQQDNAPIHKAKTTIDWFIQRKIALLPWPAQSPDLNPIANVWGLLARLVYEGGRQFNNLTDLKNEIL